MQTSCLSIDRYGESIESFLGEASKEVGDGDNKISSLDLSESCATPPPLLALVLIAGTSAAKLVSSQYDWTRRA